MTINGKTIDNNSLEFDGIHSWDYPKFCDAFICAASFEDGTDLTDEELDELNDDSSFVHESVYDYLY